jgi:hypothetical protein
MYIYGFGIYLDINNTIIILKFQDDLKYKDGRHSRDTIILWVQLQLECFSY